MVWLMADFFSLAGCDGSRGFWQSLTKRETVKATPEVLRLREKSSAHSTMTFGIRIDFTAGRHADRAKKWHFQFLRGILGNIR